jgi:8-oxo-dGTP diphosphatase
LGKQSKSHLIDRAATIPDDVPRKRSQRPARTKVAARKLGFKPLKTERLTLRPLQGRDAETLHRLVNDWEVVRTLAELPYPYPRSLADEWIASTRQQLSEGVAYHLAITGRDAGKEVLVGVVGLRYDLALRRARLGYWVGRAFWGHGVATEASSHLTKWAFNNLKLEIVTAEVTETNSASAAVLRRIGFRAIGSAIRTSLVNRDNHIVQVFEATRDDIVGRPDPVVAPDTPVIGEPDNAQPAPVDPATADPATADPVIAEPVNALPLAAEPVSKPLVLVAACALVDIDGRVLLAKRPPGKKMAGLWEFPGGKLNAGETPEVALIRELKEELGIDVTAACLAPFAFASHDYDNFHLLMPLFLCRRWKGNPEPRENQVLAWVRAQKLTDYDMPPADKPLIPLLRDLL